MSAHSHDHHVPCIQKAFCAVSILAIPIGGGAIAGGVFLLIFLPGINGLVGGIVVIITGSIVLIVAPIISLKCFKLRLKFYEKKLRIVRLVPGATYENNRLPGKYNPSRNVYTLNILEQPDRVTTSSAPTTGYSNSMEGTSQMPTFAPIPKTSPENPVPRTQELTSFKQVKENPKHKSSRLESIQKSTEPLNASIPQGRSKSSLYPNPGTENSRLRDNVGRTKI